MSISLSRRRHRVDRDGTRRSDAIYRSVAAIWSCPQPKSPFGPLSMRWTAPATVDGFARRDPGQTLCSACAVT
jgi:hypothetical protein